MKLRNLLLLAALLPLLASGVAEAQSPPPVNCPVSVWFAQGYTPTPAQWQSCWNAKQNFIPYTPLNKAGDTMLGELLTSTSGTANAGFNLPPGQAPTSPVNGDLWTTSSGLYAQIGGATVGPFTGGGGTVTAVSVATANGVSAVVANPTTTPALTFSLGAITPTSVAASGAVSGTTVTASTSLSGQSLIVAGVTENMPPSGNVVGTTDTQNLTNKSIAASEINSGQLAIANGGTGSSTLAGASIVTGPASATSGNLATFNGGTGKIVQDSGVSLAAPGAIGATTPGAATFTGVTLSTTTGIVGTTTNNAAAAGSVGEDILATVAVTATGLSSGTTANIASISLTAGDWEVFGSACFGFGTATSLTIAISQVSAGSAPSAVTMANNTGSIASWYSATTPAIVSSGGGFCLSTIITRISLASTTTEILWENATFTTSTLGGYGTIEARRLH